MAAHAGAFGKIPALGDFLRLALPTGFLQVWDEWLQSSLLAVRETLGPRWNDCYLSAPIWRFSLPAGLAGEQPVSGVLMASVDRVGRQYPLTFVAPLQSDQIALHHFGNDAFFEELEVLALNALEQDLDRDTLGTALQVIVPKIPQSSFLNSGLFFGDMRPEQALAAQHISQTRGGAGLWTTSVGSDHRMLICGNLPTSAQFEAMIDLSSPLWQNQRMARPT